MFTNVQSRLIQTQQNNMVTEHASMEINRSFWSEIQLIQFNSCSNFFRHNSRCFTYRDLFIESVWKSTTSYTVYDLIEFFVQVWMTYTTTSARVSQSNTGLDLFEFTLARTASTTSCFSFMRFQISWLIFSGSNMDTSFAYVQKGLLWISIHDSFQVV